MVAAYGGSGETLRDCWCTPLWLAEIINLWDPTLDPCSNNRSHIRAKFRLILELGDDGLRDGAAPRARVFINPPYARGQVIRWVRNYRHTNFVYLLRWAPDTEWFGELWPYCWGAWFPRKRINFEPPPEVKSSSNPFPHALYFAQRPTGAFLDALLECGYFVERAQIRRTPGGGGQAEEGEGGTRGRGSRDRCHLGPRGCEGRGPCKCAAANKAQTPGNGGSVSAPAAGDAGPDGVRGDRGRDR